MFFFSFSFLVDQYQLQYWSIHPLIHSFFLHGFSFEIILHRSIILSMMILNNLEETYHIYISQYSLIILWINFFFSFSFGWKSRDLCFEGVLFERVEKCLRTWILISYFKRMIWWWSYISIYFWRWMKKIWMRWNDGMIEWNGWSVGWWVRMR